MFMRRTSNITAVAKLLSHRGIDLKRQLVSKNQMGRLQCSGERRNNDVYKIKLTDFDPSLLSLRFSERSDWRIEYHGIRLVWIVNRIEGRLSVSNKVNCHFGSFQMLKLVVLSLKYLAHLCHSQPRLHREPLVSALRSSTLETLFARMDAKQFSDAVPHWSKAGASRIQRRPFAGIRLYRQISFRISRSGHSSAR